MIRAASTPYLQQVSPRQVEAKSSCGGKQAVVSPRTKGPQATGTTLVARQEAEASPGPWRWVISA